MSPEQTKSTNETEPLLPPQQSSSAPITDRPRTVRHHRRALSGRSTRSHLSQISFGPNSNDPSARQVKREADGRARSRFLKALLLGIGLWLVVGLVFGWAGLHRSGWRQSKNRVDYGAKPSVPNSDGIPIRCAKFEPSEGSTVNVEGSRMPGETLRSKASFSIPINELDHFFIHGKGSFAKGHLSIDATSESDDAQIQVIALTNDDALVDLMTVCHVDTSNLQSSTTPHHVGLGIYTPTPEVGPYPDSDLEFRVKVKLPKGMKSIAKLTVQSNLFAVNINELSQLHAREVEMMTTAGRITIDELMSDQIELRTNNGHIEGSFKVSKGLKLSTTNGAIIAKVALVLLDHTSSSSSGLQHLPNEQPKASVTVDVASVNGAVSVQYVDHPTGINLYSYARSTNGRAHVEHTPTYEGNFEVETTWGSADVKGPSKSSRDPNGLGRDRQKFIKTNRDELGFCHISGTIWWGENDEETRDKKSDLGGTVVKTTLGSARLTFS